MFSGRNFSKNKVKIYQEEYVEVDLNEDIGRSGHSYSVEENRRVQMNHRPKNKDNFRVSVKRLTGEIDEYGMRWDDTMEELRSEVKRKLRVPKDQRVRIIYNGKHLSEGETFAKLQVPNGALLHMVLPC